MKTAIKITALMLITVLALLACTPEVELTQRDFTEIRDAKDPKYGNVSHTPPSITGIPVYVASPGAPSDIQKELTINFPTSADILNKDITTDALKEFISIYTFTNGESTYTEASVKLADVIFDFVSRHLGAVVIKLQTVPDRSFIVKIDATKYTFANGLKMDNNNDGITGQKDYDDFYQCITPSGAGVVTMAYTAPTINISLDIIASTINPNTTSTLTEQDIRIATLSLGSFSAENRKTQQKDVIESLMPRINFQKYDAANRTWTDVGTKKLVDSDPDNDTSDSWYVAVTITPQDGDIYRTYAVGMKNLTTEKTFLGIQQKIIVKGGSAYDLSSYSYIYNTVISNPLLFASANRQAQTSLPVRDCIISSDTEGRNVKLEIYFNSITVSSTQHWLSPLEDPATFKKNFKLAYLRSNPNGNITIDTETKLDDLVLFPIKNVMYDSVNRYGTTPAPGTNRITVTLDPSYQISQDKNRRINLLLAPGFKYDNDNIVFGDFSASGLMFVIDGVNFWRVYGSLGSL